jgi:hypothetical protein
MLSNVIMACTHQAGYAIKERSICHVFDPLRLARDAGLLLDETVIFFHSSGQLAKSKTTYSIGKKRIQKTKVQPIWASFRPSRFAAIRFASIRLSKAL